MRFWWVTWEEWESGECNSTHWKRELVFADSGARAVDIIMENEIPEWYGDTCFDRPVAAELRVPDAECVVPWPVVTQKAGG